MRKLIFSITTILVMGAMFLFLGGCQKEEAAESNLTAEDGKLTFLRTGTLFQDSSQWESIVLQEILSKSDTSISNFIQYYGLPRYDLAFQKRSDDIKITNIPTWKNGNLTGVFKLFNTIDDTIRLEFFSMDEINTILIADLSTKEYHVYRGAIQSVVISLLKANEQVPEKYTNWLINSIDRIEERVKFYCIEKWECYWDFPCGDSNVNLVEVCTLISRECWIDWTPRDFPSTLYRGGGPVINWNNFLQGGSGGSGNGSNNNNNDTRTWEQIKLENAKECIRKAGIKGIMAEAKVKEKAKLLCGTTYNDLLMQAYDNLIDAGKDCTQLANILGMFEDLDSNIEAGTAWTKTDGYKAVSDYLDENPHIDPCTGKNMKNDLLKGMCDGEVSMAGLDAALDGEDYINLNDIPIDLTDCSKTPEQNIADFNKYMRDNGGCTRAGFQAAVDMYLGISSVIDQNKPTLSSTRRICADVLRVTPHTGKPGTLVSGISGLQFSFNNPITGINLNFSFGNLLFDTSADLSNCTVTMSEAIAFAINSAVATMQKNINADPSKRVNKLDLLKLINRFLDSKIQECSPENSARLGKAILMGDRNSFECGGADFVTFNAESTIGC